MEPVCGTVRFVETGLRFWNLVRCCELNLVLQGSVSYNKYINFIINMTIKCDIINLII